MSGEKYLSYIGKPISDVKIKMLNDYPNLCLVECDLSNFYNEIHYVNALRVLVIGGNIIEIQKG
jgi:hypothetical protein